MIEGGHQGQTLVFNIPNCAQDAIEANAGLHGIYFIEWSAIPDEVFSVANLSACPSKERGSSCVSGSALTLDSVRDQLTLLSV